MEPKRIADQIRRSVEGEAWHGPALAELLKDVTAEQAAEKVGDAHSIWELALHVETWLKAGIDGVKNKAIRDEEYVDWPDAGDASDAAWTHLVSRLRLRVNELSTRVEKLAESELAHRVEGRQYDLYFLLHGMTQHIAYHGGQIALLKKLVR